MRDIFKYLYKKIIFFIKNQKLRYIPYRKLFIIYIRNRNLKYKVISLKEAVKYKKSNTIFILGSGPSIKKITKEQWKYISIHDSFGINFSFLLDFVPTFHSMEDGKIDWYRKFIEKRLESRRKKLSKTIWFISNRHLFRFIHPRLTPGFFPENPIVCIYKFPDVITLENDRPFKKNDFSKTIVYRGSLSLVLHLIDKLDYKNIVLLGIDLNTPEHFFYDMEEMKEYVDYQKKMHDNDKFEYMITKEGKYRPFDEYLFALNDFYFRPKNINLYIGTKDNILYPNLETYSWDD